MSIDLDQTILDGGRQFVNFFEGRILTGRDLRDEQSASRQGRNALGRGIGAGVVHGFDVTDATPSETGAVPVVRVAAGLAINRDGQTLDLKAERSVRLAVLDPHSPNQNVGAFDLCADQPSTSDAPTTEGFHLLTVAPATGYQEEAPKSGLEDNGTAGGCGRRYVTLGLRFRLVRFDPALIAGGAQGVEIAGLSSATSTSARSRLRNLVAHLGLGSIARADFPANPFLRDADGASDWFDWGLESALATPTDAILESCEVPLAVLRLRGGQFSFIDMWTVRRAPRTPAISRHWPLVGPYARPETDAATVFQFQEQLRWLLDDEGVPPTLAASEYFRRLPPVGYLPFASASNFLPDALPPIDLDPRRLVPVVEEALSYPAVDLHASPPPAFNVFRVSPSADWLLFVTDAVPSEELQAAKCAELEDRINQLETLLDAPGTVTGRVMVRISIFVGAPPFPASGAQITATPEGGTAADATTTTAGVDGRFSMTLPPSNYTLLAARPDGSATITSQTITVERAANLTVEMIGISLPILDFEPVDPGGPIGPIGP
ncbi:hypothetical protein [Sedimentitalea sp.]|uniref:hypothetical protein n=1 Tax=Sedimentitalea sp. TaxID=2048915 RepID=UPI003297CD0F